MSSRILIAEDERNLVAFLEKGLRAAGYVTTAVGDGPSAIALARDEDFELLILDLGLPGWTAPRCCGRCARRAGRCRC